MLVAHLRSCYLEKIVVVNELIQIYCRIAVVGVISCNGLSVKTLADRVPCSVHHQLRLGVRRDGKSRLNMHRDFTCL